MLGPSARHVAARHSHIPNVSPRPEDNFPGAVEFNKIMASSGNKVKLQKLVKEHKKTQISRLSGGIIYCEAEMSTNLRTGAASVDFGFKHPEADTMLLCAYAKLRAKKLQRSNCSSQRGYRRVRASSICLASASRISADQKQK